MTAATLIRHSRRAFPPLLVIAGLLLLTGLAGFGVIYWQESRTPRLVALMYHRFLTTAEYKRLRGKARVYAMPVERFRDQMTWLRHRGYHAVSLADAIEFAKGTRTLPQPAVLITIDDGCRSVADAAGPILKQLGLRATLFVTTDPTATVFDPPGTAQARLTDAELARLDPTLFDLGAHGVTHRPLRDLADSELRDELCESRAAIQKVSGRDCLAMGVPGNWYDERVLRMAGEAAYYEAVFTSDAGAIRPGSDLMRLPRLNIAGYTSLDRFRRAQSPLGLARRRFTSAIGDTISPGLREEVEEWVGEMLPEGEGSLILMIFAGSVAPAAYILHRRLGRRAIVAPAK